MRIITREEWGAKYGRGRRNPGAKLNVIMHHTLAPALPDTATPGQEMAAMRTMERVHVEENGWEGIAYNHVHFQSGRVYEGRGWGYQGAHAGPGNPVSEGFAFAIDGRTSTPAPAAIASCRLLIVDGIRAGAIASAYRVSGHRDWMEGRDCPGDAMYQMIQSLRHDSSTLIPKVIEPALVAEVIPPNLERIILPTRAHFEEAARVRGLDPSRLSIMDAVEVTEAILRIMVRSGVRQAKPVADVLAEIVKERA